MRARSQKALQLGAALAVVLPIGEVARAHDMEHLAQSALHPTDPDVMVLRFVQGGEGLFYTDDGGVSWRMLCKSAVYEDTALIHDMIVTAEGRVMLATSRGAYEDDGHGCGWTQMPELADRWVLDLAAHPTDPSVIFAVASDASRTAFGVVRRDASGEWSELDGADSRLVQRLYAVQTDDGVRLYASALVDTVAVDGVDMQNYVIRVSDDEGQTWLEHAYGPVQGAFRLAGVDPSDPDRLIAVVHRPELPGQTLEQGLDHVLVSSDGGETFELYTALTDASNVAFAPDGRVWIGDLGSSMHSKAIPGLWFAPNLATAPQQLAEYPVACLAYQAQTDTLLACQRWWFGPVDRESNAFRATLRFHEVDGFVQCAGADPAMTCRRQLCRSYCSAEHFAQAPVCSAYDEASCSGGLATPPATAGNGPTAGEGEPPDGGRHDIDAVADAGGEREDDEPAAELGGAGDEGCGCSAIGTQRAAKSAWVGVTAVLGLLARRTRTRRRSRGR